MGLEDSSEAECGDAAAFYCTISQESIAEGNCATIHSMLCLELAPHRRRVHCREHLDEQLALRILGWVPNAVVEPETGTIRKEFQRKAEGTRLARHPHRTRMGLSR